MFALQQHEAGGHLILVVDDDCGVRSYIKAILQHAGDRVLEAADGLEALEVFHSSRGRIDLVITDIRMPRMAGTELARSIRADYPTIPLIFVSGEPATDEMNDPGNGLLFVEKPFAPRVLLDAANRFLN